MLGWVKTVRMIIEQWFVVKFQMFNGQSLINTSFRMISGIYTSFSCINQLTTPPRSKTFGEQSVVYCEIGFKGTYWLLVEITVQWRPSWTCQKEKLCQEKWRCCGKRRRRWNVECRTINVYNICEWFKHSRWSIETENDSRLERIFTLKTDINTG